MFRLIKRFYNKLNRLIYRKGYTIHFDKLGYEPNFSQYDLKGIGTWLLTKGNQWICTSEITDKEKFSKIFFEKTGFTKEEITITERYFPFTVLGN